MFDLPFKSRHRLATSQKSTCFLSLRAEEARDCGGLEDDALGTLNLAHLLDSRELPLLRFAATAAITGISPTMLCCSVVKPELELGVWSVDIVFVVGWFVELLDNIAPMEKWKINVYGLDNL
jgi:hypothetical protein